MTLGYAHAQHNRDLPGHYLPPVWRHHQPILRKRSTPGTTHRFIVTPNSGYQIDSVTGCDGSLGGTTYTTGPITANCTVTASFRLATYVITATAGSGGTISPSSQTIDHRATASFTVTPYYGYQIDHRRPGGSLSRTTYTTGPITAPLCTVTASFRLKTYLITATAGSGGTISPSSQMIDHGATASFVVQPNSG
ncbi:MAG: hypothetical protein R3F36_01395 [Candidatus Competibacteraceae bacterium]